MKKAVGMAMLCSAAVAAQGQFTHKMPESTGEKPTCPAYAEMARDFADPFGKVRTGCYWYWMAGNVTCEGVRKDLEAMKRAGIDRAYIEARRHRPRLHRRHRRVRQQAWPREDLLPRMGKGARHGV